MSSENRRTLDCLLVGEQTLPMQCAEILLNGGHRIVGIITSDKAFRDWAARRSIPFVGPSEDLVAFASRAPFDCLFSIVNGHILSDDLLKLPSTCAINFHDGPLPHYAGFNVTNWALLNREKEHGITWHAMGSRLDSGDIYQQVLFEISEGETALTLNAKCFEAGLKSFRTMIDGIAAGSLTAIVQDLSKRTYIARYNRPEGACLLRFERTAEELDALCRAVDFGPYPNPIGKPKFWDGGQFVCVSHLDITSRPSVEQPGTIVDRARGRLEVATRSSHVVLHTTVALSGDEWDAISYPLLQLPALDPDTVALITKQHAVISRHERFWLERLAEVERMAAIVDAGVQRGQPTIASIPVTHSPAVTAFLSGFEAHEPSAVLSAAFAAYLARSSASSRLDLGFQDCDIHRNSLVGSSFALTVPLLVSTTPESSFQDVLADCTAAQEEARRHVSFPLDIFDRYPELQRKGKAKRARRYSAAIRVLADEGSGVEVAESASILTFETTRDGRHCRFLYDAGAMTETEAVARRDRFAAVLEALAANPKITLASLPLMSDEERSRILYGWNRTETVFDTSACIHQLFESQVEKSPDNIAVIFRSSQITYRKLNEKANRLAAHLLALGASPDSPVAVFMDRSIDMVVALLGILKAGSTYVPIDPTLPRERVAFMLTDTAAALVLSTSVLADSLPACDAVVVCLDRDWPAIEANSPHNPEGPLSATNLAYVIYTSGSTGQPKGVCITHRNVVNFFSGMDAEIGSSEPGVWLAVTSISFDISVLELFWTLTRGYKVVLVAEADRVSLSRETKSSAKPLEFSLYYFASSHDPTKTDDKYRLFLDGVRFADSHDFAAIWTPERHFHSFGGLYPNPSVASAAAAVLTSKVKIRAGSVVLPLHNPIRVAEEWSLVDNLSNGRVGISFASGWHARDFVLAPENYADAKGVMFRNIETVRKLWRGEKVAFTDGKGNQTQVSVMPRPCQPELPVWVTAASSPETFRMAGERGYNLLTHLLGQKLETLAAKIAIYRKARAENGFDEAGGCVTLMLHTFVAETTEVAKEAVREPLKNYLASSVDLIKDSPWSFPTFTNKPGASDLKTFDLNTLNSEEMDALLEHAFERYFETSGLFGTPEDCAKIAQKFQGIGVNEIACLIDFGVDVDLALENLRFLDQVRSACLTLNDDYSLPAQIQRHSVTHLQCTPSMAKMLVLDPDSRAALTTLKKLMVGGEALPCNLAQQLSELVSGDVHNMYGPTETTIWSTTSLVRGSDAPIGKPIANTTIYILDQHLQPCPAGETGELYIGGAGLSPGYYRRPQLTIQRFIKNPFQDGERIYKTGDIGRYRWDGTIEYLGRSDFQVKIRGFRIELGEIEEVLTRCSGVLDSVVVSRQIPSSDPQLVAYYIPTQSLGAKPAAVRAALKRTLPDYMVPGHIVELAAFPLTHNGKVDRKALPDPDVPSNGIAAIVEQSVPTNDVERLVAGIWCEALNRTSVGVDENFFDLGGHSLLVVQVNHKLRETLNREISLVDTFRFPTIRSLAKHLSNVGPANESTEESSSRGRLRREMLSSRLHSRARA